ncbi:MAG TPA: hypothetical protein VKN36_06185 [Eudoraea sp.]|nr:hypothetical protein [Eudoraea sp.]
MSRKIKLIWDFRGQEAGETAKHHAQHLKDYILAEALGPDNTGYTHFSSMHSIAYMVVDESHMLQVRDALVPHRGELYDGQN